jgi:hypothetical protein
MTKPIKHLLTLPGSYYARGEKFVNEPNVGSGWPFFRLALCIDMILAACLLSNIFEARIIDADCIGAITNVSKD